MKKNLLLSTAIGDMMGVPYEFHPGDRKSIIPHQKCTYSDDTVCTFGVAKALIEGTDISETLREACRKEPGRGNKRRTSYSTFDISMFGWCF